MLHNSISSAVPTTPKIASKLFSASYAVAYSQLLYFLFNHTTFPHIAGSPRHRRCHINIYGYAKSHPHHHSLSLPFTFLPFHPPAAIISFPYINVSQCSVLTQLMCGEICNNHVIASFPQNVLVEEFGKICQYLLKLKRMTKWDVLWDSVDTPKQLRCQRKIQFKVHAM